MTTLQTNDPIIARYCPAGQQWFLRVNDGPRMLLHQKTVRVILKQVAARPNSTVLRVSVGEV
jgi:hypothetical protein